jgi:hypothetical protein
MRGTGASLRLARQMKIGQHRRIHSLADGEPQIGKQFTFLSRLTMQNYPLYTVETLLSTNTLVLKDD